LPVVTVDSSELAHERLLRRIDRSNGLGMANAVRWEIGSAQTDVS
jgi:hypothetical protein